MLNLFFANHLGPKNDILVNKRFIINRVTKKYAAGRI